MAASSSTQFATFPRATSRASVQNPVFPLYDSLQLRPPFPFNRLCSKNGGRIVWTRHAPLKILCMHESRAPVVTKDSWEHLIMKSDIPVLVEFYASWCGPCRMVHRVIEEISAEYSGRLKCFVLNTDSDLPVAEEYEIKAVPVVLMFKNGEKRESVVGTMPKEFYISAIERILQP